MTGPKTPRQLAKPTKMQYTVYLEIELMERLKTLARKDDTNASKLVNEAVRYYVAKMERAKREAKN